MDQAQLEIELGAWKNIAIDKQVLLSDVTTVLGLDEDCSNEALRSALKDLIAKASGAEDKLKAAQADIDSLKKQLTENAKSLTAADAVKKEAGTAKQEAEEAVAQAKDIEEKAESRIQAARAANAEELKKVQKQVKDKQKELQSINKILADTPENVVKKMKAMKKDKFDESTARKAAEADSRSLRKQVKELEQDVTNGQEVIDQAATIVEAVREIKTIADSQKHDLEKHVEDASALAEIPEIDEKVLEAIEQAATEKEEA